MRVTSLFTKCPRPGRVKTRLLPVLAPAAAADLATAMLLDTAERLAAEPDLGPELALAEPDEAPWFEEHVPWLTERVPQAGSGLAERLAGHFERRLAAGAASVVVLGSDQPLVPLARYAEAHAALEAGADVVLGPDVGGGYYLVGLRAPRPELFLEVAMSSGDMCTRTVALARDAQLRVELLPTELDVDTPEDLERLGQRVEADPAAAEARAPRTLRWLNQSRARSAGPGHPRRRVSE